MKAEVIMKELAFIVSGIVVGLAMWKIASMERSIDINKTTYEFK